MYDVIGSRSSRALRVMWALEELNLPYRVIKAAPRSAEVLALNPSGKVPVLKDGDNVITDSTAILTYLADKHGGLTFAAGTIERAHQDGFTHCILDEIDAVLWTAARHSFSLPEDQRVPEVKASLKWEFEGNLNRITDQIQGPYLMGETFTLPDIILAHCGGWAKAARFPSDNEKFAAYLKRCRGRAAFLRLADG